jgi:hypothetical protein
MVISRSKANIRRKHTAEPLSVAAYFALEIKDWDWTFSFGANDAGDWCGSRSPRPPRETDHVAASASFQELAIGGCGQPASVMTCSVSFRSEL